MIPYHLGFDLVLVTIVISLERRISLSYVWRNWIPFLGLYVTQQLLRSEALLSNVSHISDHDDHFLGEFSSYPRQFHWFISPMLLVKSLARYWGSVRGFFSSGYFLALRGADSSLVILMIVFPVVSKLTNFSRDVNVK